MKIASFNVNSVKARLHHIEDWLKESAPDILMIQELKSVAENVPVENFEALGYQAFVKGQKAYNGVATLVKKDLNANLTAEILPGDEEDEQARFIDIEIDGIHFINIYLPNGNPAPGPKYDYKLSWMKRLHAYLKNYTDKQIPFAIGGDYNVMPEDIDCHAPENWRGDALIRPESRAAFRALEHLGLTEAYRALHPDVQEFTFWDYQGGAWPQNNGIRIDHFLLTPTLADILENCEIDKEPRDKEKASDHTPIIIELNMDALNPIWKAA
jgi:exodeoxyribonuclease-3